MGEMEGTSTASGASHPEMATVANEATGEETVPWLGRLGASSQMVIELEDSPPREGNPEGLPRVDEETGR